MNNAQQQTDHFICVYLMSHHIEHLVYLSSLGYYWVSSKLMSMAKQEVISKCSRATTVNPFLRSGITFRMIERTDQ